jgi:tetratricopeptide (TPR) repeat protein
MMRILRTPLSALLVLGLGLAAAPLRAQQGGQHAPHVAQSAQHVHEAIGWVPREILQRPVTLRQGVGNAHEKVTTSSAQAQAFYDQGLSYLQSYVWIEAARSFYQAARLDPNMGMAYLGLSDCFLGLLDYGTAYAALKKALSFSSKMTPRERWRMEIRAKQLARLEGDGDNQEKLVAYRNAINSALIAFPNDPWFWMTRAFADEPTPLGHGQGGGVDTIAYYERALQLSPDNFAAHHYLAHTFENLGRTKEALEHAQAYARVASAIPHAHHMVGHELRKAGRTEEAIAEFRKTEELENAYYQSEHISAKYDWHHSHNLRLMAMCYQSLGQMKIAEQLLREEFSLPTYTDSAEFNRREWPEFLLGRGRAQEALEAARNLMKGQWALGRFAGHSLAGRALLAMDRLDDAKAELSLAERESENIPSMALGMLPFAGALRAEILLRENKTEQGESLMKDIVKAISVMPGPDNWSEALFQLESIAQSARQSGDWDLAESVAKQMIEHDPTYAGGYYALALAHEHRGEAAAAREQFAAAEKLWSKADSDLPELRHIHQELAARR